MIQLKLSTWRLSCQHEIATLSGADCIQVYRFNWREASEVFHTQGSQNSSLGEHSRQKI